MYFRSRLPYGSDFYGLGCACVLPEPYGFGLQCGARCFTCKFGVPCRRAGFVGCTGVLVNVLGSACRDGVPELL